MKTFISNIFRIIFNPKFNEPVPIVDKRFFHLNAHRNSTFERTQNHLSDSFRKLIDLWTTVSILRDESQLSNRFIHVYFKTNVFNVYKRFVYHNAFQYKRFPYLNLLLSTATGSEDEKSHCYQSRRDSKSPKVDFHDESNLHLKFDGKIIFIETKTEENCLYEQLSFEVVPFFIDPCHQYWNLRRETKHFAMEKWEEISRNKLNGLTVNVENRSFWRFFLKNRLKVVENSFVLERKTFHRSRKAKEAILCELSCWRCSPKNKRREKVLKDRDFLSPEKLDKIRLNGFVPRFDYKVHRNPLIGNKVSLVSDDTFFSREDRRRINEAEKLTRKDFFMTKIDSVDFTREHGNV